jgi:hypothetical protein
MDLNILLPIAGSLIGVMVSTLVAYFVSKRQVQNEIVKVGMQIDATYRAKLYERRLATYPELAKHLASLGGAIRAGHVATDKVRQSWEVVREWDAENSIFMSPLSMTAMIALRKKLIEFSALPDESLSNKKSRGDLMPVIVEMQLALKTELGVMHAEGFHKPERVLRMREALNKDRNEQDL